MQSRFTPIVLEDYIEKPLRSNPEVKRTDLRSGLEYAIAAHQSGKRCSCGDCIWVIGSAEAGLTCFTCITGESQPSDDYEIDIASADA
jgi:hypothetical protein